MVPILGFYLVTLLLNMSFVPWIIWYSWFWPFDFTRKDFTSDDRTSNWFSYQSWNAWSDVNGWYWRALTTDWNWAIYKSHASIKNGSYIRMRWYVNYSYWWWGVIVRMDDTYWWATSIQCAISTSSYGGYTRFHVYHNWTLKHTYNIAQWVFYEIELKKTSTWYTANLYSTDWVTVLTTFSEASSNVPTVQVWYVNTTTDNLQYVDWFESKIYY